MNRPSTSPCESLAERYQGLLEVAQAIAAQRDLDALCRDLAQYLPRVVQVNFVALSLHDPVRNTMRLHTIQANVPADLVGGHEGPVDESPAGVVWQTQQALLVHNVTQERRWPKVIGCMMEDGANSFCFVPLTTAGRRLGAMGFLSLQKEAYSETDLEFLQLVANQVAVAVDSVLNYESLESAQQVLARERDRLRLLLDINNAVVSHLDLRGLLKSISACLRPIIPHDAALLTLQEPGNDRLRLHALDLQMLGQVPFEEGVLISMHDTPEGQAIMSRQPVMVGPTVDLAKFSSPWVRQAVENGVRSGCAVPLITHERTLGALSVVSQREDAFIAADVELLAQCANQIAVAVANAQNFSRAQRAEQEMKRQLERERLMLEVTNAVVSHLELSELIKMISTCLRRVLPHDLAGFCLYDSATHQLRAHAMDFPSDQDFSGTGDLIPLDGTPEGLAVTSRKTVLIKTLDLTEFRAEIMRRGAAAGLKSGCAVPLIAQDRVLGTLSVVSRHECAFTEQDAELLGQIGSQVALAVANSTAYQEIANLRDKLKKEKLYLEEEIRTEYDFEEIIGDSAPLKRVLKQVEIVAPTDSTVLILGETGTGKELIARAIHNLSGRQDGTFVKLNCAAIPTGLLESELFGHEKGAFTGAIATKIGRFELADKGTLFLDEVGEIPLELQVKLLRVLQEQEFERLGSTRTIRVNVRVVAATNRDLPHMVEEHTFRSDLYYRLKVFPITVPSLRERADDIPALVRYFTQKFALRMKKRIETVPAETMKALQAYPWPGNVRELENCIERAVILSSGTNLLVPLSELKQPEVSVAKAGMATLEQAERDHILKVLRDTKWVIGGAAGAAAKLGMKRTTLQSKMQKLAIIRPS